MCPPTRVLRADAAFLLAGECPECGLFHLDRVYRAESLPANEVAVTTAFARICPAFRYNLCVDRIDRAGMPARAGAQRIAC